MRALRVCAVDGCPELVVPGERRCELHQLQRDRAAEAQRATAAERGYGTQWRRVRDAYIARHRVCEDPFGVHADGPALATDVDHIIPRARGGTDEEENLQALCHACHARKTACCDGGYGNAAHG